MYKKLQKIFSFFNNNVSFFCVQEIDENVECRGALKEFFDEALDSETKGPNYNKLRRILQTELEKHANEPYFEKLDWQITQTYRKKVLNNRILFNL